MFPIEEPRSRRRSKGRSPQFLEILPARFGPASLSPGQQRSLIPGGLTLSPQQEHGPRLLLIDSRAGDWRLDKCHSTNNSLSLVPDTPVATRPTVDPEEYPHWE